MTSSSLSNARGPTLSVLSEHCASADSPTSSPFAATASYSFISETPPASSLETVALEIPDILTQATRFQSIYRLERMRETSKFWMGSVFARPMAWSSSRSRERARSFASSQVRLLHLPIQLAPDHPPQALLHYSFFNETGPIRSDVPLGLGLLFSSASTSNLQFLSPLAVRSPSPTPVA
jgi:hypothetical protein